MNCLQEKGKLRPYWVNTASDTMLREAFAESTADVRAKFQLLIAGNSVETLVSTNVRFEDIKAGRVGLFSVLLFTGYLKVLDVVEEDLHYRCKVAVPNQEVLCLYKDIFTTWLTDDVDMTVRLRNLFIPLFSGKIKQFARDIQSFLMAAASIRDYVQKPEAFYHGFMLALTSAHLDHYYIESNTQSGFGYLDLMLIPKDPANDQAIILEFKHIHREKREIPSRIAAEALKQIDELSYASKLDQYKHIHRVIKVGLAFDGKEVYYDHAVQTKEAWFTAVSASSSEGATLPLLFDSEDSDESKGSTVRASDLATPEEEGHIVQGVDAAKVVSYKRRRVLSDSSDGEIKQLSEILKDFLSKKSSKDPVLAAIMKLSREEFISSAFANNLHLQAGHYDFTVQDVPGYGDCFFHAMADQLSIRGIHPGISQEMLRERAASFMVEHQEEFKPFIEALAQDGPEAYIQRAYEKGEWADDPVITALARELNITLVMIRSDGAYQAPINEVAGQPRVYLGYYVGLHYVSLRGEPNARLEEHLRVSGASSSKSAGSMGFFPGRK